MARRMLWSGLALAPLAAVLRFAFDVGDVPVFCVSALALVPLAWLIGAATEQAAEHTGAGVGGFLNASFGNAPELIIALFAVSNNLPQVVRGSLAGSVISNLLLVLGVTQLVGPEKEIDRRSLLTQIGLVGAAVVLFVPTVVLGYTGHPERHAVVVVSAPISVALLVLYLLVTRGNLLRHSQAERGEPSPDAWSLPTALVILG